MVTTKNKPFTGISSKRSMLKQTAATPGFCPPKAEVVSSNLAGRTKDFNGLGLAVSNADTCQVSVG